MKLDRTPTALASLAYIILLLGGLVLATGGCGDRAMAPPTALKTQVVSGLLNGFVGSGSEVQIEPEFAQRETWPFWGGPRTPEPFYVDEVVFRALVAAIDEAALGALPDVIGCPGCADGPVEWLEVRRGAFHKRVEFSPWDDLGAGNAALLQQVRALRGD